MKYMAQPRAPPAAWQGPLVQRTSSEDEFNNPPRTQKFGHSPRSKEQAATALKQAISKVKRKVRTITLDNGTEFHDYKKVEAVHAVKFYFATPYHSWERGTNENTNGLIRQYLPKGMCMRHVTQADCDAIAAELNNRPRRRLGFKTPSERFARS